MRQFPPGFLWGAATSSHQVEGGNELNDWWDWEAQRGAIADGTRSGAACEWWAGRAEQDLSLAVQLGHNAHRLSLEWSRLEPEIGRYDEASFDRYRAIFDHARAIGLTLFVTLNHFTLPRWAKNGWCDPALPIRFAAFAAECARRLGDAAKLWATLNEPSVLAFMGYGGTRWPPGLGAPLAALKALRQMLRAHALAWRSFKAVRPEARVGIVLNAPLFEPARPVARDRAVAALQDWCFTGIALRALDRTFDHLGLNYYGRYAVRFDSRLPALLFGRHVQRPTVRTSWNDWGQPYAEGLRQQLVRMSQLGVPLYVTENGIYDNSDRERPRYLTDHVAAVHRAIAQGADVRGYFHWSLIDNFEWAEGWSTHFGLVELDRDHQHRRPRESARVYAEICRSNAICSPEPGTVSRPAPE